MHSILLAVRPRVPNPQSGRSRPQLSLVPMPPDQIDKQIQFKRWLALFFINRGKYRITEKGYTELAPQEVRQNLEFGEPVSDRKREPRLEERRQLTKQEIRDAVAKTVAIMLEQEKAEELYDNGLITKPGNFDWKNREVRVTVIKKLLEFLDKNPKEITKDDFESNGLSGLLSKRYKNSPYLALVEAGYAYSLEEIKEHAKSGFKTDKIYPCEMSSAPHIYEYKESRIAACKWLIWKIKKDTRDITVDDFYNNGLGGLLGEYYKNSPYLALVEADYAYSLDEIKKHARTGFATDKFYPWGIEKSPSIYKDKEIRLVACKWLIWRLEKEPKEITYDDFLNNGLGGLINHHYKNSPYDALLEAGLVTQADEVYMRSSQHTH